MYFKMRKKFKENKCIADYSSPIRSIASPKMIRGLSIPKAKKQSNQTLEQYNPDVRIKNMRGSELARKPKNKTSSKDINNSPSGLLNNIKKLTIMDINYSPDAALNGIASPHKINKANKLRRYEENKGSELERAFSPINQKKTFGVRMVNTQAKASVNLNFNRTMTNSSNVYKDEMLEDASPTNSLKISKGSPQK